MLMFCFFLQLNEEEEMVEKERKKKQQMEEEKREAARLKKRQEGLKTYKVCVFSPSKLLGDAIQHGKNAPVVHEPRP